MVALTFLTRAPAALGFCFRRESTWVFVADLPEKEPEIADLQDFSLQILCLKCRNRAPKIGNYATSHLTADCWLKIENCATPLCGLFQFRAIAQPLCTVCTVHCYLKIGEWHSSSLQIVASKLGNCETASLFSLEMTGQRGRPLANGGNPIVTIPNSTLIVTG